MGPVPRDNHVFLQASAKGIEINILRFRYIVSFKIHEMENRFEGSAGK
jgi:hypothetical protein